MPAEKFSVALTINQQIMEYSGPPLRRLLDVLREDFGLCGSKEGCGEGECGACTVLLGSRAVNSCLVPIAQVREPITTIEGATSASSLIQQLLVELGGTQCGICTPGIVLAATAALKQEPTASRIRLRELLAGNLCRCTGYQRIIDAVHQARPQP